MKNKLFQRCSFKYGLATFVLLTLTTLVLLWPSLEQLYSVGDLTVFFIQPLDKSTQHANNTTNSSSDCLQRFFRSISSDNAWLSTPAFKQGLETDTSTQNAHFATLLCTHVTIRPGQLRVQYSAPASDQLAFYNYVIGLQRHYHMATMSAAVHTSTNAMNKERLVWPEREVSKIFTTFDIAARDAQLAEENMRTIYIQSPVLIKEYYKLAVSPPTCQWLSLNPRQRPIFDMTQCGNKSISQHQVSSLSIPDTNLAAQKKGKFGVSSFLHVLVGGIVTDAGGVFVRNFKIVLPMCFSRDPNKRPPNLASTRLYDEVFVISQFFGEHLYHMTTEDLPRLAPYLSFLRSHPTVYVHVIERSPFSLLNALFEILGLDPKRIVSGFVRARIVYLPQTSGCGRVLLSEGQLLSREYKKIIENKLTGDKSWRSVILIQRTKKRFFNKHKEIEQTVRSLAAQYGLRFELFADNPPPSLNDTMLMFYRARVVVAPHGAGLINIIYSRPGTVVIEGLCKPPAGSLCYMWSSFNFGLRYHGVPSPGGCDKGMNTTASDIGSVLEQYLQLIKPEIL